jgi:hypothetical protein
MAAPEPAQASAIVRLGTAAATAVLGRPVDMDLALWHGLNPAALILLGLSIVTLSFGAAPPIQARRRYLWRETPEGQAVFFDDGRPFHRLGPNHLADRHHCAPDLYDVTYDFSGWPHWTQSWRVTGPRKDMAIESRFQPLG